MARSIYFPGNTIATNDGDPDLADIAAGEFAIVPADSSMISTSHFQVANLAGFIAADANTNFLEKRSFKIIRKLADGTYYSSIPICMHDIVRYQRIPYSAGTAQVTTISPAIPATQYAGDTYTLKIIDLTTGTMPMLRKTFQQVHTGTDFTVKSLIDNLVTLINADTDLSITAANAGDTTLTLTADKDVTFAVALDDMAGGLWTSVLTTKMIPATGTLAKIQALEKEIAAEEFGYENRVLFPKTFVSMIPSGSTDFTVSIIEMKKEYTPVDGGNYRGANTIKLYLCEVVGAGTQVGELIAVNLTKNLPNIDGLV
jgi:hypothetical protein